MLSLQGKNIINSRKGNVAPPEPNYPITATLDYSNTVEAQENDLKPNFMKIIGEMPEEEMNKPLKGIQENTNSYRK